LIGETLIYPINLNDPAFDFPVIVGNPVCTGCRTYERRPTRTVGGTGTYDAIMATQAVQSKDEFLLAVSQALNTLRRIRSLAQSAGGRFIHFLGKDQAYWSSVMHRDSLTSSLQRLKHSWLLFS
jgi:hypothetical protein